MEPTARIATSREVLLVLSSPEAEVTAPDKIKVIESDKDEIGSEGR